MVSFAESGSVTGTLPSLGARREPTITDQVYEALYARVVDLTLPPGTKLSEAEVAAQMNVSRQPVRDAFYRLSQLGFIQIRPQRATTVTPISETAVRQARFIRSALEIACIRHAAEVLTGADHEALAELIDRQEAAIKADRREEFHDLDDLFHRRICEMSDLDFAWALIKDNKGHMDRARFLSLSFGAPSALADHRDLLAALRARDADKAAAVMRVHLDRINDIIARLRTEFSSVFGEAT